MYVLLTVCCSGGFFQSLVRVLKKASRVDFREVFVFVVLCPIIASYGVVVVICFVRRLWPFNLLFYYHGISSSTILIIVIITIFAVIIVDVYVVVIFFALFWCSP